MTATSIQLPTESKTMASCAGYRCLDRDECYAYDQELKRATFAHASEGCDTVQSDERLRFQYLTKRGELETIW